MGEGEVLLGLSSALDLVSRKRVVDILRQYPTDQELFMRVDNILINPVRLSDSSIQDLCILFAYAEECEVEVSTSRNKLTVIL